MRDKGRRVLESVGENCNYVNAFIHSFPDSPVLSLYLPRGSPTSLGVKVLKNTWFHGLHRKRGPGGAGAVEYAQNTQAATVRICIRGNTLDRLLRTFKTPAPTPPRL